MRGGPFIDLDSRRVPEVKELILYWGVSSVVGFVQTLVVRRYPPTAAA